MVGAWVSVVVVAMVLAVAIASTRFADKESPAEVSTAATSSTFEVVAGSFHLDRWVTIADTASAVVVAAEVPYRFLYFG